MAEVLLSVIISTFSLKYKLLESCLQALRNQTFKDFEVIVVNDGDDIYTEKVVSSFQNNLKITFNSRPNDKCVSRSRNLGAELSSSPVLVFLDADIMLNSRALEYYYNNLSANNNLSMWGKIVEKELPSKPVQSDKRIVFISPVIRQYAESGEKNLIFMFKPYFYTYSGNFGLHKELFISSGGFNESFTGWGHEDIEFGLRVYKNKGDFRFFENTEGLHLIDSSVKEDNFYTKNFLNANENIIDNLLNKEYTEYMMLPEKQVMGSWNFLYEQTGNDPYIEGYMKKYQEEKRIMNYEL